MSEAWLLLLGLAVGCFGTLIGAGGGFILAPILLFMYPAALPDQLAAVSLAVVFANATVGSITYWLRDRVDVRSALTFAAAAIPAAIAGVWINSILPRQTFAAILGSFLILGAILLLTRPLPKKQPPGEANTNTNAITNSNANATPQPPALAPVPTLASSTAPTLALTIAHSHPHRLGPHVRHNRIHAAIISTFVGLISSVLGIGGGIVHVPAMVHILGFPVHFATATSHMVVAITAGIATAIHIYTGAFSGFESLTLWLAAGAMLGSPLGATLSRKLAPALIIRALALALGLVGVRVLWSVTVGAQS